MIHKRIIAAVVANEKPGIRLNIHLVNRNNREITYYSTFIHRLKIRFTDIFEINKVRLFIAYMTKLLQSDWLRGLGMQFFS